MKLTIEVEKRQWRAGELVRVRLVALNDSYQPVSLDRRALVGPNPVPARPAGGPLPISVEPRARKAQENHILLNPWCFYGRERTFDMLPPGEVTFHGYLLRREEPSLMPVAPHDPEATLAVAEPVTVTILP